MAVKQLERYPVDLYYLVDVSASMQANLDHVGVWTVHYHFIRGLSGIKKQQFINKILILRLFSKKSS